MEKQRGEQIVSLDGDDGQGRRVFQKKLTVLVEIVGEDKITMMELLKKVREDCGVVIGCRYKNPKEYELTMNEEEGKEKILDGLKIKNSRIMVKEINNNEMVVSFLNLPTYIEDEEIIGKLTEWGVKAASPVKRRMWPGTDIADGTRFLKVKFTDTVKSLPYSTKFETLTGTEHFRVIHDRQVKVCRVCIQPGHIVRDCPNFKCYKCGIQGHYVRECDKGKCKLCKMVTAMCVCRIPEEEIMGSSLDLYESVEEAITGKEKDEEDEQNEEDIMVERRAGEEVQEPMDDSQDAMGKFPQKQVFQEEEELLIEGGGNGKKGGQEKANQDGKEHKENQRGRDFMTRILETPLIQLEEEMDMSAGNIKMLKRKMKGTEEETTKK